MKSFSVFGCTTDGTSLPLSIIEHAYKKERIKLFGFFLQIGNKNWWNSEYFGEKLVEFRVFFIIMESL